MKTEAKKKNPNSDRNATIASYLLSIALHLLLLILFALMAGVFGGSSQAGGITRAKMVPVGVVMSGAPDTGEIAAAARTRPEQPVKLPDAPEKIKDNQKTITSISDIKIREKEKPRPTQPQPQIKKTAPKNVGESPKESGRPNEPVGGAETGTYGTGGNEPTNVTGSTGKGETEGSGTGIGPFPNGSFGLAKTPDCKKDDADNNKLIFQYRVSYKFGSGLEVEFVSSSASANNATLENTRRIIELGFSENLVASERGITYTGYISCKCGEYPKCEYIYR